MKAILEIVKRYLFEILCGVAAIAGVALVFVGLGRMSKVEDEMRTAKSLQDRIGQMARGADPVNRKAVDAQQRKIEFIRDNYAKVLDFVRQANYADPLTPNAFPEARRTNDKLDFRRAYQREVEDWLGLLKACTVPTDADIQRARDRMKADTADDAGLGADPTKQSDEKDDENPFERNPRVRAALHKARAHYMYADQQSFHQSEISASGGPMYRNRPPEDVDMWHAQIEVWIQRSIIDAIVRINEKVAARLQADDIQPWIGNLPIKELVSIQISEYYLDREGTARVSGGGGQGQARRAVPPGKAAEVFTGNKSGDLYELLQLTVRLIIDAREVTNVIAGICENSFHTPLKVTYRAVKPDPQFEGKIYGNAPVVEVTIDLETVMFSELFLPLMPDEILTELNKRRPEPEKARET